VGAVVFLAAAVPGLAADSSPGDALLARSRRAIASHEFHGVVRIEWRSDGGMRSSDVTVTAVDGGLRMGHGAIVEDDGRAWLRTDASWETLWADSGAPQLPSVATKYDVQIRPGRAVSGRATRELALSHDGHVVERYWFDRDTGITLARTRYDDAGRVSATMRYVRLDAIVDRTGRLETPRVGTDAPKRLSHLPGGAHRELGDGFAFVAAHRVDDETQLQYTDGVFTASIVTRDGDIDWDALPVGGHDEDVASVHVRRYRTSAGTVLAWESDGNTLTCVTDAPDSELGGLVRSLGASDDGAFTSIVKFVTGPFSWF
jgi:hypothetical protein